MRVYRRIGYQVYGDVALLPKLYRSFDKDCYADAFASGHVWITTLQECRRKEDVLRADPGEGKLIYKIDYASSDEDPSMFEQIAKRGRFGFKPGSPGIVIKNCEAHYDLNHALLLCTSRERVSKFGPYCVRIDDSWRFFSTLHCALTAEGLVGPKGEGFIRDVIYGDREFAGLQAPNHPGFIKPVSFRDESEMRMLWPLETAAEPRLIKCRQLARYCTKIA